MFSGTRLFHASKYCWAKDKGVGIAENLGMQTYCEHQRASGMVSVISRSWEYLTPHGSPFVQCFETIQRETTTVHAGASHNYARHVSFGSANFEK